MIQLLAYRPFLDPIDLHQLWWVLILPMAFFTAMAYKAVRAPDMAQYWRQTIFFALQVLIGIGGLYFVALISLNLILPLAV